MEHPNGPHQRVADIQDVVLDLFKIGAIKFGEFKLTFGEVSLFYIDLRETGTHISVFKAVGSLVSSLPVFEPSDTQQSAVCGIPVAALPLATFVACSRDLPFLLYRKTPKTHGTGKQIEGSLASGTNCIVVDDICSSGGSIVETVRDLRANGFLVTDAVVFLDRESGGVELLEQHGIKLHFVIGVTELCKMLVSAGKLDQELFDKVQAFVAKMRSRPLVNSDKGLSRKSTSSPN